MTRSEEINILIDKLVLDVLAVVSKSEYHSIAPDKIINNGRLIDAYQRELKEIEDNLNRDSE